MKNIHDILLFYLFIEWKELLFWKIHYWYFYYFIFVFTFSSNFLLKRKAHVSQIFDIFLSSKFGFFIWSFFVVMIFIIGIIQVKKFVSVFSVRDRNLRQSKETQFRKPGFRNGVSQFFRNIFIFLNKNQILN